MAAVDARPTIAIPDDDPYLWLEETDGPRALGWVEAENAKTVARFGLDARFAADRDTLTALFDRSDKIPYAYRHGDTLFSWWTDAAHPRGVWRTTTLESYRTDNPKWDVLLDLDALAARENEDWVFKGWKILPGTYDRAIFSFARGGTDAVVLREFDLKTRDFVAGGFALPAAKGGCSWLDRDTLILCSAFGDGMGTRTDHARTVRLWRRGADPLSAPVIYEIQPDSINVWAERDYEAKSESLLFVEQLTTFDAAYWMGDRSGAKTRMDFPSDAKIYWLRGWFSIRLTTAWSVGGETFAPNTLLGISLAGFLAGERRFTRLFEPGPRRALQDFVWSGDRLLLSILDNLEPVFEILTPKEGWARERVAGLPEKGLAHAWRFDPQDEDSNGDFLAQAENPLVPPSLFLLAPGRAPEVLKRAPQAFDAKGLVVTRHEAISTDGERIPYTLVGPAAETGDAPLYLYGYGGYGFSQYPTYSSSVGKLWLERGGTRVIAHIRGGGEFGPSWHHAGRREGRRLSHDDFAAVAADLVRRGVTKAARIAAEGGSNGGTLIANMLTRYPERFGALFCTIPVIDLRRLKQLKTAWMDEVGDPDKPEDWAYMAAMSAYHAAVPGKRYPPILLATNRRDDRVLPGHARKMAAKLHAMGYEAYYYEPEAGGHGYGRTNSERAAFIALGYRFLRDAIGWKA